MGMTIPCITSFDMNAQLLAWVQGKTGGKDKGVKDFVWIGHKTVEGSPEGEWVPKGCEDMQKNQFKSDMVCRNGCAFKTKEGKPYCTGSDLETCTFDDPNEPSAVGCAVLVNVLTDAGAASMNLPPGPISSYDQLHSNWIKSQDCKSASAEPRQKGGPLHLPEDAGLSRGGSEVTLPLPSSHGPTCSVRPDDASPSLASPPL